MNNNKIRSAVDAAGGATRVANHIGVSGKAVYRWIESGRVSSYDKAKKLAKLSGYKVEELRPLPFRFSGF